MKQRDAKNMLAGVVAAKLHNDRQAMMALWGKGYTEQVDLYRSMIEAERQRANCDLFPAALNCCQRIQCHGEGDALTISMLMATAVEMIESETVQEPRAPGAFFSREGQQTCRKNHNGGPPPNTSDYEAQG